MSISRGLTARPLICTLYRNCIIVIICFFYSNIVTIKITKMVTRTPLCYCIIIYAQTNHQSLCIFIHGDTPPSSFLFFLLIYYIIIYISSIYNRSGRHHQLLKTTTHQKIKKGNLWVKFFSTNPSNLSLVDNCTEIAIDGY